MKAKLFLYVAALLLSPVLGRADVINGDFENGGGAWSVEAPAGWTADFPDAGGNPDGWARIRSPFGDSGGEACISQGFQCGGGERDVCVIGLDYRLAAIDAGPFTARIRVTVDSIPLFESVVGDSIEWARVSVTVPCGYHVIALCLVVDPGNNGWEAGFDNVVAECLSETPAEAPSWGRIKSRYREFSRP